MPLRVLYDHQIFEVQRWGGISRYFVELMTGLAARPDDAQVTLALARTLSEHRGTLESTLGVKASGSGFQETFLGGAPVPLRRGLRSVARRLIPALDAPRVNRAHTLAALAAGAFDLFHPTYYNPYFLEALGDRPFVVTVHDLTHEVWPELFRPRDRVPGQKAELARRATRVIAISENTRREAIALLGLDPNRVDVISHGFERRGGGHPAPALPALPERFVLFTGLRGGYKNWAFTMRALAPLLRDTAGLELFCTGPVFSPDERAHLAALGLGAQVHHLAVGEDALPALYARAAAFVFPSLHEGFGLPVLEAFAAGCPAALARRGALPEVGADAALYFDPKSASELRDAVARLLGDRALAVGLAARGRARLPAFSWTRTVERHLETYRRALGDSRASG